MVESDPGDAYRRAGLSEAEIQAVADVATELGSADPLAAYLAVPLPALAAVLRVLDRLTDAATPSRTARPHGDPTEDAIYGRTLRELLARLDAGQVGLVVPKEDDPETVHAFLLRAHPDVCDFVERLARQAQAEQN